MRTILLILTLLSFIYTAHDSNHNTINPYFSPGLQIGVNSAGEIFISGQLTIGIVGDDLYNDFYPPLGITFGKRFYYKKNKSTWDSYNYLDVQVSILTLGFGYGIITNGEKSYNKLKLLFSYILVQKHR